MKDSRVFSIAKKKRRVLSISAAMLVLVALGFTAYAAIISDWRKSQHEGEQQRAQLRQESFDKVKNGDAQVDIMDLQLLDMLAEDETCVENLDFVFFSMMDLKPDEAASIAKLTRVKHLAFYEILGADYVLEHATELPVESIYFGFTKLSNESPQVLADFGNLRRVRFEPAINSEDLATLKSALPDLVIENQ